MKNGSPFALDVHTCCKTHGCAVLGAKGTVYVLCERVSVRVSVCKRLQLICEKVVCAA